MKRKVNWLLVALVLFGCSGVQVQRDPQRELEFCALALSGTSTVQEDAKRVGIDVKQFARALCEVSLRDGGAP